MRERLAISLVKLNESIHVVHILLFACMCSYFIQKFNPTCVCIKHSGNTDRNIALLHAIIPVVIVHVNNWHAAYRE